MQGISVPPPGTHFETEGCDSQSNTDNESSDGGACALFYINLFLVVI